MSEKKMTKKKIAVKSKAKTVKNPAKTGSKAKAAPKVAGEKTVVKKTVPKTVVLRREPVPEVVRKAARFLDDRKAENIAVLDMRSLGGLYDYFVIATAANAPHLKALGDGLQRLYKNEQYKGFRAAGTGDSGWVIVDYDGVMVHVFSFEMRSLYDLEKLWKDAPRVEL